MKVLAAIFSICLTLSVSSGGCSQEEPPPPPVKKFKVVKPIKRPAPKKTQTPPTIGEETAKSSANAGKEVKPSGPEAKAFSAPEKDVQKKARVAEEPRGYYSVKKGDSLSSIAAGEDVYGDALKWPLLFRLNMDKLGELIMGQDFLQRDLPEGVRLKIILPDEAEQNLKKLEQDVWAINVISTTSYPEIIPIAIRLMKNGYSVYMSHAKVKGKHWTRLRVGFFRSKSEADTEMQKIISVFSLVDSWTVKIGKKEREEFGGYSSGVREKK